MWKQIENEEDPDWVEWHKEIMSAIDDRCMLKVWRLGDGEFAASVTSPDGRRGRYMIDADDLESAKREAEQKATGENRVIKRGGKYQPDFKKR